MGGGAATCHDEGASPRHGVEGVLDKIEQGATQCALVEGHGPEVLQALAGEPVPVLPAVV